MSTNNNNKDESLKNILINTNSQTDNLISSDTSSIISTFSDSTTSSKLINTKKIHSSQIDFDRRKHYKNLINEDEGNKINSQ
jgi:hypothetical protein